MLYTNKPSTVVSMKTSLRGRFADDKLCSCLFSSSSEKHRKHLCRRQSKSVEVNRERLQSICLRENRLPGENWWSLVFSLMQLWNISLGLLRDRIRKGEYGTRLNVCTHSVISLFAFHPAPHSPPPSSSSLSSSKSSSSSWSRSSS